MTIYVYDFNLVLNKSFQFAVNYVYILQRPHDNDTVPFHITYQLPLGPVLPSLGSIRLNFVHPKLYELFHSMNLYESEQSYQRKQDTFDKLSLCIEQMFNKETLHCFTHAFLPYGSFRIVRYRSLILFEDVVVVVVVVVGNEWCRCRYSISIE